ncbi:hypothetical protein A3D11_03635 [Candidatus Peribacteria bacterium RIFCSPHIGHO2_02_FULL_49_16]|nr:MAG: hypothetical protein A2880_04595 [Candidatus Peribacteria bacterium RIFCSPHIGHO2_01_FULL_49_38]OGJ58825.1 MAG: hypothetical protein A3D11_03635 [Candidatus Peribacteria bacterium RIFCSPHIGHO2_02_FULL_49_16]
MNKPILCIVGLGYVGLPLAYAFVKKHYTVYGFDISQKRIEELRRGLDTTNELTEEDLQQIEMTFSNDPRIIQKADIVILAIPTPVDSNNKPDVRLLESASATVGENLKKGAIIVYESTVYPGVTEEICGPILEKASGMTCGTDFMLGYSPERINPGDKKHTVETIMKVVGANDPKTLTTLTELYRSIVQAGIHPVASIKVAEMSKAIENAQRDLNIAYINEVAMMCSHLGISTKDVLEAAGTKWNFLKFTPGLVGGHCIGVDPYYLVEKAKQLGMDTHIIAAGRSVNDAMSVFVAKKILDALHMQPALARILVLGLTFKENVPDTRNSKSKEVIEYLEHAGCSVEMHDPYRSSGSRKHAYDAVVLLVAHKEYVQNNGEFVLSATKEGGLVYDLKSVLDRENVEKQGKRYMAL